MRTTAHTDPSTCCPRRGRYRTCGAAPFCRLRPHPPAAPVGGHRCADSRARPRSSNNPDRSTRSPPSSYCSVRSLMLIVSQRIGSIGRIASRSTTGGVAPAHSAESATRSVDRRRLAAPTAVRLLSAPAESHVTRMGDSPAAVQPTCCGSARGTRTVSARDSGGRSG